MTFPAVWKHIPTFSLFYSLYSMTESKLSYWLYLHTMFVTECITNYIYICTLYRELYTGDIYCIMCVYELYSVLLSREVVCICYVYILAYNYIFHYRWFSLSGLFCRLHRTRAGRIERPRMIIVSGLTRHVSLIHGKWQKLTLGGPGTRI